MPTFRSAPAALADAGPVRRQLSAVVARLSASLGAWTGTIASTAQAIRASGPSQSTRFPLRTFFGIGGFLLTSIAATALTLHHKAHDTAALLDLAESQNSALARAFANEIWLRHGSYIGSVQGLDGNALRARPETAMIDEQLRKLVSGLPVLKVKIYTPEGLTIYSSDPAQIGQSKSGNNGFQKAVKSGLPVSQSSYRGTFSAFSGVVANVDLAETYVPLVLPSGAVGTVFELYTNITPHIEQMATDNIKESAIIVGTMLLTFLGMWLVVSHADRLISRQHDQLARTNADLSAARALADGLNETLKEKIAQLERSNRDLKDFAHVAAHDMQEPLRKIETFGQRLLLRHGDRLPEDGRMFVERMNDASARMRRLVTDLLAYARLNKEGMALSAVDLRETIDDVLSDLQVRIDETKAQIRVDPLPTIEANPSQMRQLMQNLIANALKFTRPGVRPIIQISSRIIQESGSPTQVQLTVSDNGIGFDDEAAAKLFKLFQRLHGRSEFEGTGIGLATCRRIAENLRGTIAAKGVPGEGATFTVMVPVSQATGASA